MDILIVDDDPVYLSMICDILIRRNHTILVADTLTKAREYLSSFIPDIVLLDIHLGDGSGLDLGKDLYARGIPVIYVTSYSDDNTLGAALRTVPFGFLAKPVRESDVIAAINTAKLRHAYEISQDIVYDQAFEEIIRELTEITNISEELPLKTQLDLFEAYSILKTLERFAGNRIRTAEALGISLRTLSRKLADLAEHQHSTIRRKTERFTIPNNDTSSRQG